MKILVVLGHPRVGSLSDALADSFVEGARKEGAEVEVLQLRQLQFDPNVLVLPDGEQVFEPDLESARKLILWCEHIVFVYPTWWAGAPALLKGFLDRVLTSGFGFEEITGGTGYQGLLGPRSAQIITTMDTPAWVYRLIYRRSGEISMARGTLGFCGLAPVGVTTFSEVKKSTPEVRARWLERVHRAGLRASRGPSMLDSLRANTRIWIQALRLQFYPMTFLAYLAGALAAMLAMPSGWHWWAFVLGYACIFLVEAATVFTNDLFDQDSDRQNKFFGPFSGGSRVLVEGKLGPVHLGIGAIVTGLAGTACGLAAVWNAPGMGITNWIVLVCLALFAIGYTLPPLKLSHRGMGELDVCFTHSFGVILCGYLLQGRHWSDPLPWLLGLPLFCSIFPAILLSGIPDRAADQSAGKRTLVVMLGEPKTIYLSILFVVLSVVLAIIWSRAGFAHGSYAGLGWIAVPLAVWLVWRLAGTLRRAGTIHRIDGTIALALLLIFLFAVFVVVNLLRALR